MDLVRIGSGICRNMFKSYFLSRMLPQGLFYLKKDTFLEIWTCKILKKWLLSYVWSVVAPAGAFFLENCTFPYFWHDNFPKSVFLVKNLIVGVISYQNIDIFAHIWWPLTNDPFIKNLKICKSTVRKIPGSSAVLWFLIEFGWVLLKYILFIWKLCQDDSAIVQDILYRPCPYSLVESPLCEPSVSPFLQQMFIYGPTVH